MANTVTVSGMFGAGHTYFSDSPVIIDISGLEWPASSPFTIVSLKVLYGDVVVGNFRKDTGGQPNISIDISTALKAIWSDYVFTSEVAQAQAAAAGSIGTSQRYMRPYDLMIYTEYISPDDGGVYTQTQCSVIIDNVEYKKIPGGQCLSGHLTEWERSLVADKANADVSHLEHTGVRYGDASTKPTSSPEMVGSTSITSWVDVQEGLTKSIFYPAPSGVTLPAVTGSADDVAGHQQGWTGHSPLVMRDSRPYMDFLFVNRRGAVETCSALMKESMSIDVDKQQYSRVETPAFQPSRSLMAFGSDGRRTWNMSSGNLPREWVVWWTMEFLTAEQYWMLYSDGIQTPRYVPVVVKPAKQATDIYDRAKQQMTSVEFSVTLTLEG